MLWGPIYRLKMHKNKTKRKFITSHNVQMFTKGSPNMHTIHTFYKLVLQFFSTHWVAHQWCALALLLSIPLTPSMHLISKHYSACPLRATCMCQAPFSTHRGGAMHGSHAWRGKITPQQSPPWFSPHNKPSSLQFCHKAPQICLFPKLWWGCVLIDLRSSHTRWWSSHLHLNLLDSGSVYRYAWCYCDDLKSCLAWWLIGYQP